MGVDHLSCEGIQQLQSSSVRLVAYGVLEFDLGEALTCALLLIGGSALFRFLFHDC
jgi:hypothetical protein